MIDIIIPIYNAVDDARACLDSVLAHTREGTASITIIDDASTEPRVEQWLQDLSERPPSRLPLQIIRNSANLGFVGTVNRGMALSHNDVVLLNSDTLVTSDWLDRMIECASSDPQTATVTPFSNNAEICSYPFLCINTPAQSFDVESIVQAISLSHDGTYPTIPTAVGFCMYISRRAIDKVGLFDAERFGRGYGEENEFCMRASAAGFVHRLCSSSFVFHIGGRSFQNDSSVLKQANLKQLLELYPDYSDQIAKFISNDPLAPVRGRIIEHLRQQNKTPTGYPIPPGLLIVTHAMGGGIEKHIQDLIELAGNLLRIEVLRPSGTHSLSLEDANGQKIWLDRFNHQQNLDLLRSRQYSRIHLHHWHGHSPEILKLHEQLALPLDITVHDFGLYCPRNHLSRDNENYCGEPELAQCEQCISENPSPWGWTVSNWREHMYRMLLQSDRVFVTTQTVAKRLKKHFPEVSFLMVGHAPRHEWLNHSASLRWLKVIVPGGLSRFKGLPRVVAAAKLAQQKHLPFLFTVVGFTSEPVPVWPELPLTVTGEYPDSRLPELLQMQRADAIWIPSQVPETWSYTLDAALMMKLPILASHSSGAVAERLRQSDVAYRLYDSSVSTEDILNMLQELTPTPEHGQEEVRKATHTQSLHEAREAYKNQWLQWISPISINPWTPSLSTFEKNSQQVSISSERPMTLQSLFSHGVEAGHLHSRQVLQSRLRELDELEAYLQGLESQKFNPTPGLPVPLRAQVTDLLSQVQDLQSQKFKLTEEQKSLITYYENSRSWRITAPLRSAVRRLQKMFHSVKHVLYVLRRGLQRWPLAWRILKQQGLRALLARIRSKLLPQSTRQPSLTERIPAWESAISPLILDTCPADSTPRVSIVIPVYGQHLHTYNCLRSLQLHTRLQDVEIILADDSSPEPAQSALTQVQGLRWIRQEKNLGFIGNCNTAASQARGEYLLLLNNDVQVTSGWLDALLAVFGMRPDAGMVGARLIYPNGQLQEAGGIVWQDGTAWNWGRLDDPENPAYRYLRRADYCSGACLMLRMADWQQLSGFDACYMPAYYEDTDLAFRIRQMGKQVYYQPEALIVHHEGITSGTDVGQGIKRHQAINEKTFYKRWQTTLLSHRPNGVDPLREVSRQARRRILIVDACTARPDADSGSVRMRALMEIMIGMDLHVTFVADNLEHPQPYVKDLQQLGVEFWHSPYVRSVSELLEKQGKTFDIVMLCRHYIAAPLLQDVKKYAPQARIWFDTIDLHYLREERMAALEQSDKLAQIAAVTKQQELRVMQASDVTLVVSPVEKKLLAGELPLTRVEILSNIHEPQQNTPGFKERRDLLFVGGFQHPPNIDAVQWFVSEVWPIVHAHAPEIKVRVVGSQMPASLKSLNVPGVEMVGFVQDLEPLLSTSLISIAPLRYGAGVKGKVNQAMAHGLPVVATSMAVEGMDLQHENEVLIADTPEDFANELLRLERHEALWNQLVIQGKQNIRRNFSKEIARQTLTRLL